MTVSSETAKSGPYTGNGVTTVFAYGFRILDAGHIEVIRTVAGTASTVSPSEYTVSGVGDLAGGNVTFAFAPASGQTITIVRSAPFTQQTDLENQGAYYAEVVEQAFDLAAMRDQQMAEELTRAVKLPVGYDPSELAALTEDLIRIADSADEIDTVAGIAADVTTVAGLTAEIAALPGQVTDAQDAADAAMAALDSFDDRYLGAKAVAPTLDNDGNALLVGAVYWDTASNQMFTWTGSEWLPTFVSGSAVRALVTATGGQTAVTVPTYIVGANTIQVYLNGLKVMVSSDYTETNQNTITFLSGLTAGDEVEAIVLQPYAIGTTGAESITTEYGVTLARLLELRDGTVADLLADTTLTYSGVAAGDGVEAGGFRYVVAASGASDQHVTTAGGVKLYVQASGNGYDVKAFGAVCDGVSNDATALFSANAAAIAVKTSLLIPYVMHVGTATTISAPIVDKLHQMFSVTSSVTIGNGLPVRPEWFGSTTGAIKRAASSLPAGGGVVLLRAVRYAWSGYGGVNTGTPAVPAPADMLTKANIRIQGSRLPVKQGNILTNGSVIEGPFGVWADNFQIDLVGIDAGPDVCAANWGGIGQDGFQATYTTAETTSSGDKINMNIGKLICLAKDPASAIHACLIERYNGVKFDSIETFWGFHGLAIKSKNVVGNKTTATLHGGEGAIFKSDGAAQGYMSVCQNVSINDMVMNACRPYGLILQSAGSPGLPIAGVKIGRLYQEHTDAVRGTTALQLIAETANAIISDVQIDLLNASFAQYAVAQNAPDIDIRRLSIGECRIANMTEAGLQFDALFNSYPIVIDTLYTDNVRRPINLFGNSVLRCGRILESSAHASETEVIKLNEASLMTLIDYQVNAPIHPSGSFSFVNLWGQWPGGTVNTCAVDLWGNKVRLRGLMRPNGAVIAHFATLAREFRPPKEQFMPVIYSAGATVGTLILIAKPDGTLNLSSIPVGLDFVSLDGAEW